MQSFFASINVIIVVDIRASFQSIENKYKINIDEIKNINDPSRDLSKKFVGPYGIPTIAARESLMLSIKSDIIAMSGVKIFTQTAADIKT